MALLPLLDSLLVGAGGRRLLCLFPLRLVLNPGAMRRGGRLAFFVEDGKTEIYRWLLLGKEDLKP